MLVELEADVATPGRTACRWSFEPALHFGKMTAMATNLTPEIEAFDGLLANSTLSAFSTFGAFTFLHGFEIKLAEAAL